ncbi:hypothetical protein ABVT39_007950 [Epinephelus coioides]
MDPKKFYGSRPRTFLALVPENPHDSDADLSDEDDKVEDPNYLQPQSDAEVVRDHSFESLDEEEMPSTSTSSTPPPLFTDKMIQHIAVQTNLYAAQELGDPIKTSPEEIEDFLAILLFMGVFNFPAIDDYWDLESRFDVTADTMSSISV